jgi:hypothetical protein
LNALDGSLRSRIEGSGLQPEIAILRVPKATVRFIVWQPTPICFTLCRVTPSTT